MSKLKEQHEAAVLLIQTLEEERRKIYQDSQVDEQEHPRLAAINHELAQVWDIKRRIEAAVSAGLTELPVPPPENPENMVG